MRPEQARGAPVQADGGEERAGQRRGNHDSCKYWVVRRFDGELNQLMSIFLPVFSGLSL